jgi:hypothetical protein
VGAPVEMPRKRVTSDHTEEVLGIDDVHVVRTE